jgi:DNA repair protein RadA/Sms
MKGKKFYVCNTCGWTSLKWVGRCGECGAWDTLTETRREVPHFPPEKLTSLSITEIGLEVENRISTGFVSFDQLLGGGIVPSSFILLSGDPGIGKSTLLLKIADNISQQGMPILYISGEESLAQTKLRAQRLKVNSQKLYLLAGGNMESIKDECLKLKPKVVIIDSLQTLFLPELPLTAGALPQIRECSLELMRLAKERGMTVIVIGHITKGGAIAGPKTIEHMVDVVLYFEGEKNYFYRVLRCTKNRFGSTQEIAIFEMTEQGLKDVLNPSGAFLSTSREAVPGNIVALALEGGYPLLLEVQALVTPTSFGIPRRMAIGIDYNRMCLLVAILEKHLRYRLSSQDVYVNIAGGLKVNDPGVDLSVVLSIASSFLNKAFPQSLAVVGEVGLSGEVRGVRRIEARLAEAQKLGFKNCIIPSSNFKKFSSKITLSAKGVKDIKEAFSEFYSE